MTPEKCKELLDNGVLKAHSEGRTIQYKDSLGEWKDIENPVFGSNKYRVKPEPKYRPVTHEEAMELLGKTVLDICNNQYKIIYFTVYYNGDISLRLDGENYLTSPKELLCNFRFIDGSPCGVLDETNV